MQAVLMVERDKRGAIRAGSTNDIERRRGEYYGGGYRGTMYYAKTKNMKKAEDRLLKDACEEFLRHNRQCRSNNTEDEGYVYLIKGRKL